MNPTIDPTELAQGWQLLVEHVIVDVAPIYKGYYHLFLPLARAYLSWEYFKCAFGDSLPLLHKLCF